MSKSVTRRRNTNKQLVFIQRIAINNILFIDQRKFFQRKKHFRLRIETRFPLKINEKSSWEEIETFHHDRGHWRTMSDGMDEWNGLMGLTQWRCVSAEEHWHFSDALISTVQPAHDWWRVSSVWQSLFSQQIRLLSRWKFNVGFRLHQVFTGRQLRSYQSWDRSKVLNRSGTADWNLMSNRWNSGKNR